MANGQDGASTADKAWTSTFDFPKEDRQPEHVLVHGDAVPLARLLEARPGDDERGSGWDETETTRFGRYAMRLWRGLLAAETVSDR